MQWPKLIDGDVDRKGWAGGNTSATVIDKSKLRETLMSVCQQWSDDYPGHLDLFRKQMKARKEANGGNKMFSPGKTIRAYASLPAVLHKRLGFALRDRFWFLDQAVMDSLFSIFECGKFRSN